MIQIYMKYWFKLTVVLLCSLLSVFASALGQHTWFDHASTSVVRASSLGDDCETKPCLFFQHSAENDRVTACYSSNTLYIASYTSHVSYTVTCEVNSTIAQTIKHRFLLRFLIQQMLSLMS